MPKKHDPVPLEGATDETIAEFWDAHDVTDYWDELEVADDIKFAKPKKRLIKCRGINPYKHPGALSRTK